MFTATAVFTALHFASSVWFYYRNPTNVNRETVIQHHELCVMLGFIALAILWRNT